MMHQGCGGTEPLVGCATCHFIVGQTEYEDILNDNLEMANQIATLFEAIRHGDAEHQRWLKAKIDEHFFGLEPGDAR